MDTDFKAGLEDVIAARSAICAIGVSQATTPTIFCPARFMARKAARSIKPCSPFP